MLKFNFLAASFQNARAKNGTQPEALTGKLNMRFKT